MTASDLPDPTDGSGPVLAVIGACGGVGSSSFAAALAASRPVGRDHATLIDLDTVGGGLDVLVGLDSAVGARWSDLRLGGGVLQPASLREHLPSIAGVGVLACDTGSDPSARDVQQILSVARRLGPVVLDVPRWLPDAARAALQEVDAAVVVIPAEVRAVVAGTALLALLGTLGVRVLVLTRPGLVPPAEAARAVGSQPGAVLPVAPWLGGDSTGRLDLASVPNSIADIASGLWALARGGA